MMDKFKKFILLPLILSNNMSNVILRCVARSLSISIYAILIAILIMSIVAVIHLLFWTVFALTGNNLLLANLLTAILVVSSFIAAMVEFI